MVQVPLAGEPVCGDGWAVEEFGDRSVVMVVDGLGHGASAAQAAREASESFRAHASKGPEEILRAAHEAIRQTRGAAMAIASIHRRAGEVRYAGVGNISGVLLSPQSDRSTTMMSHNGTVGYVLRRVQEITSPWTPESVLVMHSDGLATQWHVDRYPGLISRHPSVIAGVLYRDFRRGPDDATVLVAAEKERGTAFA